VSPGFWGKFFSFFENVQFLNCVIFIFKFVSLFDFFFNFYFLKIIVVSFF
jgi:hypothetical protein